MLILLFISLLAFYVAWNLGANDVANSMGTSVGSKAITLRQAIIIAGILEFLGAVFFGANVANTLATKIINPDLFISHPSILILGMISVLFSCGFWLQIATAKGLPVASSHAIIGAIAGMSFIQGGMNAVDWENLGLISIGWIITPFVSGIIASSFFSLIKQSILSQKDVIFHLKEWIPWLAFFLFSIFGVIVFPIILNAPLLDFFPYPKHDLALLLAGIAIFCFTIYSFKLLESTLNPSQVKFALNPSETVLGRFQVLSACFVAFAHGSNDVGNAIAPLVTIIYILNTNKIPSEGLAIPLWVLVVGGAGIVAGLAVQGKNVITTVGEKIITLQPSRGFSAEIATATTILVASRFGFPVSTSHALIGSVVGIGLSEDGEKVRFNTVKSVVLAWLITLPITAIIGAFCFWLMRLFLTSWF
jgi:PiT family inorganic phosphate transporter